MVKVLLQIKTSEVLRVFECTFESSRASLTFLVDITPENAGFGVIIEHVFGRDVLILLGTPARNIVQGDVFAVENVRFRIDHNA